MLVYNILNHDIHFCALSLSQVRYYNAWEQDDRLYIQMELCSGTLAQLRRRAGPLPEPALLDLLS